jgi:hypothetical protein
VAAFDASLGTNGLHFSSGSHCARKIGQGVCSSCRATLDVLPDAHIYFELSVMAGPDSDAPVVAIGLAPPDCPLNVVVGSWAQSVGLYSDGSLLVGGRWVRNLGNVAIKTGATVGVLACLVASTAAASRAPDDPDDGSSSDDSDEEDYYVQSNPVNALAALGRMLGLAGPQTTGAAKEDTDATTDTRQPLLVFNVNGAVLKFPASVDESVRAELKLRPPLYPTVSLISEQTEVWCRFDQQDIIYRSRQSIGAPAGVRVYCLDGSLLLTETD